MMSRDHTELEVWIEGRKLVHLTYALTAGFPKEELFALVHPIRRAATSVPSNIAAGCERRKPEDTLEFLHVANGSLDELENQFHPALTQNYISKKDFEMVNKKILLCKKLINGSINYYKK